jgi:hypothetical protein
MPQIIVINKYKSVIKLSTLFCRMGSCPRYALEAISQFQLDQHWNHLGGARIRFRQQGRDFCLDGAYSLAKVAHFRSIDQKPELLIQTCEQLYLALKGSPANFVDWFQNVKMILTIKLKQDVTQTTTIETLLKY